MLKLVSGVYGTSDVWPTLLGPSQTCYSAELEIVAFRMSNAPAQRGSRQLLLEHDAAPSSYKIIRIHPSIIRPTLYPVVLWGFF